MIISVSCSEDAKEKVVLEKNKVLFAATIEGGEDEVVELPHMIRYNELVPVGKRTIDDMRVERSYLAMLLNQQPRRQRR